MKFIGVLFAVVILAGVKAGYGQIYPDTLWVPVTYYDFHSNHSNPEFQPEEYANGATKGMVQRVLGANKKPVVGSKIYFSRYLDKWYKPWVPGDNNRPIYDTSDVGEGSLIRIDNVGYDTSFKNIVIEDSLPFIHVGGTDGNPLGTYRYRNYAFFPLNGKGFGAEISGYSQNFSFSMELHWEFTMVSGLTFRFIGDDDVWAFINDTLRMDLGGIHDSVSGAFGLDTIPGLIPNQKYNLDFFYAERQTIASRIQITTNIITAIPTTIHIRTESGEVCAGKEAPLIAEVVDQNGLPITNFNGSISWDIISTNGNKSSHIVRTTPRGDTAYFAPTEAYALDSIRARLFFNGREIDADTITQNVTACTPAFISIEAMPPPFTDVKYLRDSVPLDVITIYSTSTTGNAFAIVRDKFGNFIEASDSTVWAIVTGAEYVDRVENGRRPLGEGIAYKRSNITSTSSGVVSATSLRYSGIRSDIVRVDIVAISYDSLQIVVNDAGTYRRISLLTMSTDVDTLLIAQGKRSDNGQWEPISGTWSKSVNLTSSTPTPTPGQTWNFSPIDTGRGTITVSNGSRSATITVVVEAGRAHSISLYANANSTAYNGPQFNYDDSAGVSFPLYAKVFDSRGVWLRQYDVVTAPITWRFEIRPVAKPDAAATFTPRTTGHQTGFVPTIAGNVIYLIATLTDGIVISDTVSVSVIPGRPDHITIQADTSRNGIDQRQLDMQSNQTVAMLYALLRDRFGNFIDYVEGSRWSSKDTSIVTATGTFTGYFLGEGEITRKSDLVSQTTVFVTNLSGTMKDSILVDLTNITYTTLRIFYRLPNGSKLYTDTIRVRTDSSMTLYAEGLRSDGQGWDIVPVTWTKTESLDASGTWPRLSDNQVVTPVSVGNGRIFINRNGAIGDTVVAIFLPGLPSQARLYRRIGTPANAGSWSIPPVVDTIVAGDTTTIVAKIFDLNNVWLSTYENSSKNTLYKWTVQLESGFGTADTLNKLLGYEVKMIPVNAYNKYRITMTFTDTENSKVLVAPLLVYVKPGAPHHLVIEGSPSPSGTNWQNDNPVPNISFGSRDSVKIVYAIVRDRFGNYINSSQSTDWSSIDPSVVTATEGLAILGEGRVNRVDSSGSTKVVAVNRGNSALRDTVDVLLSQVSYDALRIVVRDSVDISVLEMRSDEDTVLQVLGKRSFDGVWVPVDGNWAYITSNGSQSATSLKAWNFDPVDTGFGIIVVSMGTATPDTVKVRINPGIPTKLELYAKEGSVPDAANPPYPPPATEIIAVAGTPFPLVAKALDHNGVWLSEYENRVEKDTLIKWTVIELDGNDSSGFLDGTTGHKRSFFPVRAYQSVLVAAELQLSNNRVLIDTVRLQIVPGKVRQLVIEGSQAVNLNRATPLDTARITDSTTTARIFAVMRDSIGNFVRYSLLTTWGVVNNDTGVTIRGGNAATGEGVVSRKIRDGVVKVFGVDSSGLRDSTVVKMLPYFFKELRIVVNGNTSATSLTMNTNQDTTLTVQGLRSDSLIWVNLNARWENSKNLRIDPTAPGWAHVWEFSPSDTGKGWIRVTLDNDVVTKPDTLPVVFTPGPPTQVSIEIITPADKRIAGEPIQVVVTIRNEDGLVPGTYCFDGTGDLTVVYSDTLGTGGKPKPFVLIGKDTLWLAKEGKQCFNGGKDTIKTVLFYATDSLHRLSVQLGDLRARTLPFVLIPGPLDSLVLQDPSGNPIGDTIQISYPKDHVTIIAIGYDRFGNRIGPIESNWTTDSTLHAIDQATRTSKVIYQASEVTDDEAGTITAIPSGLPGTKIRAQVFVEVLGPLTQLTSAVTRDANGNGYLDQIILTFTEPVAIPKGYDFSDIEIKRGSDIFLIDSIIGAGSGPDSVWVLALREKVTNDPQTSWVPEVSFGRDEKLRIDAASVTAVDGAGPVIWSVKKSIENPDDVKKDQITIVFSEPVQRADGEPLSTTDTLKLMVYVWELVQDKNGKSHYNRLDSMLVDINFLQAVDENGKVIVFLAQNSEDFAPHHYFSIKVVAVNGDTTAFITDKADQPNLPEMTNQRVRVIVTGPAPKLIMAPNPTRPSETYVKGRLLAENEPDAWGWVFKENRGALMQFTLILPPNADTVKGGGIDPSIKIRCIEKIYDFVGNPVNSAVNEDLAASLTKDNLSRLGSRQRVSLYWNGFSKSGRPVAPGIYKIVIYIEYKDPKYKKHNYIYNGILGIAH